MRKYIYAVMALLGMGLVPSATLYAKCPYPITHYFPSKYICEWNKPEIQTQKIDIRRLLNTNEKKVMDSKVVLHDPWWSCTTGGGKPGGHSPYSSELTNCR